MHTTPSLDAVDRTGCLADFDAFLPLHDQEIVEKDFPGFHVGKMEKKMGLRGSHSAELFFEDWEVPVENVLGEEGQGYVNALKILANGRAGLAARITKIYEGTSEIQKNIIAAQLRQEYS